MKRTKLKGPEKEHLQFSGGKWFFIEDTEFLWFSATHSFICRQTLKIFLSSSVVLYLKTFTRPPVYEQHVFSLYLASWQVSLLCFVVLT